MPTCHRILGLLVFILLSLEPTESLAQTKTTDYSGTIGKLKIEMRLTTEPIMETNNGETYQRGERYKGHYSYAKEGRQIQVSGTYDAMGPGGAVAFPVIGLREETDGQGTGYFAGRFGRRGVYSGTWYSAGGKERKLHFVLYPKRAK